MNVLLESDLPREWRGRNYKMQVYKHTLSSTHCPDLDLSGNKMFELLEKRVLPLTNE